ncbi:MAG: amidase [Deltaproteobacteria bacterium]
MPRGSEQDATSIAEAIARGETSAEEQLAEAVARIESVNGELNAVIQPLYEEARERVRAGLPAGPFRGVPILLKDLDAPLAGAPFHCGTRFLKDASYRAPHSAFFVEKLLGAGFVPLGKTNTPELGLAVTTEPLSYGASRNPWNPAHSTGGSSGGSAAAVASGMVPLAHASDGGGSIRIPASECGLVGLKPSRGRVSLGPDYGSYWQGFVANHVVTRTVRDCASVLDIVAGPMPGDPYAAPTPARPFAHEVGADVGSLRIGMMLEMPGGVHSLDHDCAEAVRQAGQALESLGHSVAESHPAALDLTEARNGNFATIVATWTAAGLDEWAAKLGAPLPEGGVEPLTATLAAIGRTVTAIDYIAATKWAESFTREMAAWWAGGFDILVTPMLGAPPPKLGVLTSPDGDLGPLLDVLDRFAPYASPFNITGQPALSLPLHQSASGLPVGVQFIAPYGREDLLLQIAAQLEEAMPWRERRPAIFAA